MPALPTELVERYLARLRVEAAPPSADALVALHRAHVRRIPWETIWIHEGLSWGIAPTTSAARIATTRRGGYCYHLNGGFAALLDGLGYHVTRHVGGVHGPSGPDAATFTNHVALVVSGLSSDVCPEGRWYVDVGLGDGLYSPVPLRDGPIDQAPYAMTLSAVPEGGLGGWHLAHDPRGTFAGMSIVAEPPESMDVFAERHTWLSTAPGSSFVENPVVKARTADSVVGMRGLSHFVLGPDGTTTTVVDDRETWFGLLAEDFGIEPRDPDPLWARVWRLHEEWTAAQG